MDPSILKFLEDDEVKLLIMDLDFSSTMSIWDFLICENFDFDQT